MSKSGSFSDKYLDGVYSKKKIAGYDIVARPSLNAPTVKHYHSSKKSNSTNGFFNDNEAGKQWNVVIYDDAFETPVLGQDEIVDSGLNKRQSGYFVDKLASGSNKSIETNLTNLNRDFLEVFPIRSEAIGLDNIYFPKPPRGISAEATDGVYGDAYLIFGYADSNYGATPRIKGFYNDAAYTLSTSSHGRKSVITQSYDPSGKVVLVGFYNESLDKYAISSESVTHPVISSGAYVDDSGSFKKSLAQMALAAFSSSKPSPFAQVNMRVVGDFIGTNEGEVLSVRNNWHFVSSGSRQGGDKNIVSALCSKQNWTSANSPYESSMMGSSQLSLLPPIRRSYKYDIRDSSNVENRIEFILTSSGPGLVDDDYYVRHVNYKDIAADQKSQVVGVDSLTTNHEEQLISTAINEPIGDELYERGAHRFLESFKTLKFKVSSSLTPDTTNEFQIGVHPLQPVRPYRMPRFPDGSGVAFIDDGELPIGPFGLHDIDPIEGSEFFEPGRMQLPRVFVPEHYITGTYGNSSSIASAKNTSYNQEWAADPKGGSVLSHWCPHNISYRAIGSSLNISSSNYSFSPISFLDDNQRIFPSVLQLSEVNDYFSRIGDKYSIVHKQTYGIHSGSGNGLREVFVGQNDPTVAGKTNMTVASAYAFSASITFYSTSGGYIVASKSFGPYYSIPEDFQSPYFSLTNLTSLLPDSYFGFMPDCLDANGDGVWNRYTNTGDTDDAFGYYRRNATTVPFDQVNPLGLSTSSMRCEVVMLTSSTDTIRDVDLNLYNTSSITIDFNDPFEFDYFLKNSLDRKTNAIGYKNLYNLLLDKSNFDYCPSPMRSHMTYYGMGSRSTGDSGGDDNGPSFALSFVTSRNRGEPIGFSDNYGDVTNFPNAMVVPGVRPFRENKSLFLSKSIDTMSGTVHWANASDAPADPSSKLFFLGNTNQAVAKDERLEPDYCRNLNSSHYNISDSNIMGVGIEGSYGFKNYIRNEGIEHNQTFYDTIVRTLETDYPSWEGDGTTKNYYHATDFYGLTKEDTERLSDIHKNRPKELQNIFVNGSSSNDGDRVLSVNRRIPPDYLSNMHHTIFLQYPKSYATASSAITAVTYSFERGGPLTMSNYGRVGINNVTDFNNKNFLFTLMSESKEAKVKLSGENRDAVMFRNDNSNFIFVQDSGSVNSVLEVGTSAEMPQKTLGNLLTNSYGDFIARASITDNRKWTFAALSHSIEDKLVVHGEGKGTQFKFYAPDPYIVNNSRIGAACSSSVVAQFAPDILSDSGNGYSVASGTMGHFQSDIGPVVSQEFTGTLHRRATENSFIDFSTIDNFKWIAEPTMVASQVNFWSGTTRIVATASSQEITGAAGNVYPTDGVDYIKSDGFVNLPVINASFARVEPDNVIAGPGRTAGDISATKGNHFSSSITYGGTGSMIFGLRTLNESDIEEPVSAYMRKFKIKQYQKTQASYGDDDYIRRVNQRILHDLGRSVLTESYNNPEFPIVADSSFVLRKLGGSYNYTLYDSVLFKDNKLSGSSVRVGAVSDFGKYSGYASSSFFYQKNGNAVFFNTNFGHFRHMAEQTLDGRKFLDFKGYAVFYTSSVGVTEPTGSLPVTDI